jgi:hypothetical protein
VTERGRFEGSCMGFTIESSVALNYLRDGPGRQTMVVEEGDEEPTRLTVLQQWPSSRGELSLRLLAAGDDLVVENDLMGRFRILGDRSRMTIPIAGRVPGALREAFLWSTPFAVASVDAEHVFVHAAAVAVAGSAILLLGDTRAGKTTLSAAFHSSGHRLLSDDGARCIVRSKSVWPGPALLRMRPDMAKTMDRRGLDLIHQTSEKTHFGISAERRGDGRPVPISAIVFLSWGPNGTKSLSVETAISRLWSLSFYPPGDETAVAAFAGLAEIADAVPIYDVSRPRDDTETPRVVERLIETCLG